MHSASIRAAALLELRARERLRALTRPRVPDRFGDWLASWDREFQWTAPHFRVMQETLDRVTTGELRRVIFKIPIRHGKTEHNTYRYCTYRFARNPRFRAIVGSYNSLQAQKQSREIKKKIHAAGIEMGDREAAVEWETRAGGSLRAVGSGSGVAGVNADGIFIDDPIGSRAEAESQSGRDHVWDWITNDLLARCEPHTFVVFTMSAWHLDDPLHRLQEQQKGRWHVVDLPGRAEEDDPLGRAPGEPLWPELRGSDWLEERLHELGPYSYAAQIQGRPRPREGGMFKWSWWQLLEDVPKSGRLIRYWDLAGTEQLSKAHDPDYTAGVLACRMTNLATAIVDVARFRRSVAQRDYEIERIARDDLRKYGGRVVHWFESQPGIGGREATAAVMRRIQAAGVACYSEGASGKKRLRAEPLASAAEAGNVYLCPGEWRDPFRAEAADFTGEDGGRHDDQIDAAAGAFNKLAVPVPSVGFGHASL